MVLLSRAAALVGSGLAFIIPGTLGHDTPVSNRYTEVAKSKDAPGQYTPVRGKGTPMRNTPVQSQPTLVQYTPVRDKGTPVQYTPVRGKQTPVQYTPVRGQETPVQYTPVRPKENPPQYAPVRPKESPPQYSPIQPKKNPSQYAPIQSKESSPHYTPIQPKQNPTQSIPVPTHTPVLNKTEVETPMFCDEIKFAGKNDTIFRSTIPCVKRNHQIPEEREQELNMEGVIRPSKDSWYRAPPAFDAAPPGEVLKIRRAPGILKSVLKNLDYADQILYTSSTSYLQPTYALTTMLVPKEWDRKYSRVVSWQVPYESANVDSSPSYSLSRASGEIHYDVLDQLLASGYHVNIPDYQGPNSHFGAGKAAGFKVIDSLRALRTIAYGRYNLDPWWIRHIAWGYGGGALATAWAYLQIKKYVGFGHQKYVDVIDNKVYAWVIGGVPIDMLHILENVNNKVPAGFAINAISGMLQEFHLMRDAVEKFGKKEGAHNVTVFERVRTLSLEQSMNEFTYANISDYFEGGIESVTSWLRKKNFHKEILMERPNMLKTPEWTTGIFVYHGVHDSIFPVEHVDKLLHEHWCNARAFIEYMRNHEGDHEENYTNMDVIALEWIARRFMSEFLSDAGKGLIERFPNLSREECLVRSGSLNAPIWDFEAYKKRFKAEQEAKKKDEL